MNTGANLPIVSIVSPSNIFVVQSFQS
ncbi:Protein of unknown function [Bacillus wiedmannii]|nr:Protein of unknown function [Bacillus wiedmannii]